MAAGDITDAGPYTLPLTSGAKAAIKALRTSANDHWMTVTTEGGQIWFFNEEEA